MKFYSFEFCTKPVKYELTEFNNKKFFGTSSRNFYPSRSLISVTDIEAESFNKIARGTFYAPIVETKTSSYIETNPFSFNLDMVSDQERLADSLDDIGMFIIIDTSLYRLVAYRTHVETFKCGCKYSEINRTWGSRTTQAILMTVSADMRVGAFVIILILYNRKMRTYEYFRINRTEDGLVCLNKTEDVGEKVMKDWEDYDNKQNRISIPFKTYFRYPMGKFYITEAKYEDELNEILNQYPHIHKPVIAVVHENEFSKIHKIITDTFHGTNIGLTWYKMDVNIPKNKNNKYPISLNFTMDETGIVKGYV